MQRKIKITLVIIFAALLVCVPPAFCEWELQKPAGNTQINDIAFIDELPGWAVGDSSLIQATSSRGLDKKQ